MTPRDSQIYHLSNFGTKPTYRYLKEGKLQTVGTTAAQKKVMMKKGRARYNTMIVRNLEWFANLQRFMCLQIRKKLEWMKLPVAKGPKILSPSTTEYSANNSFTMDDFQ